MKADIKTSFHDAIEFAGKTADGRVGRLTLLSMWARSSAPPLGDVELIEFRSEIVLDAVKEPFDVHLDLREMQRFAGDVQAVVNGKDRSCCLRSEEDTLVLEISSSDGKHRLSGKLCYSPWIPTERTRSALADGLPYPRNAKLSMWMENHNLQQASAQLNAFLDYVRLVASRS
jgi:hypothetical protein